MVESVLKETPNMFVSVERVTSERIVSVLTVFAKTMGHVSTRQVAINATANLSSRGYIATHVFIVGATHAETRGHVLICPMVIGVIVCHSTVGLIAKQHGTASAILVRMVEPVSVPKMDKVATVYPTLRVHIANQFYTVTRDRAETVVYVLTKHLGSNVIVFQITQELIVKKD